MKTLYIELRELIGYPFTNPLIANHNYYLEFYISCADSAPFALEGIGAYFSVDTPFFNGWPGLIFTPQVHSPLGYVLNDVTTWTKISGNFIAGGGENVMTLGVLFPDSALTIDTINTNTLLTIGGAYYYLDDVTLIDCTAVGLAEIAALDFQLLNNPVNDVLYFTSYQKITNAYITDMLGEIILQNEFNDVYFNYQINVATLPRGIYLLAVEDKNKRRVVQKFLKM
ncbi:MAG: T9SS type A sorting domain-containing protein [Bacteroidetes bacterium]|nr:T9SS type A sorting domain-containing protein [Bacteroidota bacterium]